MKKFVKSSAIVAAVMYLPTTVLAEEGGEVRQLETVNVTASGLGETTEQTQSYTTGEMNTATKMDLSVRETPQSVSVVTRTQMDDFQLTGINDLLERATGVTVEQIETDRVYYTSRGFEITNFQQDGLGVPLTYTIDYGNADTALYDRVEIVRGASGLMSGAGNLLLRSIWCASEVSGGAVLASCRFLLGFTQAFLSAAHAHSTLCAQP